MSAVNRQDIIKMGVKMCGLRIYAEMCKRCPCHNRTSQEIQEQIDCEHKFNEMCDNYFGVPITELTGKKKTDFDRIVKEINRRIQPETYSMYQ